MPLADKLQEAAAKYIAEMLLGLALLAIGAIAILADRLLPPEAFEQLGSYATGRIMLGLCLTVLALIAWVIYLHPKLKFDPHSGAFRHAKTGIFYCTKCKVEKRLRAPLQLRQSGIGWDCLACGKYYRNPDFKERGDPSRRPSGPHSWMAS